MTRINVVPVECLLDKHLLAEYKEITRPFNKVINRIEKYGVENALGGCVIPEKYTLGSGHETFFFDKLEWLYKRYWQLFLELCRRDYNIDHEKLGQITSVFANKLGNTEYWNTYHPTQEDMYLNMARLAKRSNLDKVKLELGE